MSRNQIREKWESVLSATAPFFNKIGELSRSQRILIFIASIGLVLGGYYYLFYAPRQETLTRLETQHRTLQTKLQSHKMKAARLPKVEKAMQEAQIEFDAAMLALPDKKEISSLLASISKSGSDAGLEFVLFQPGGEIKKDFYAEIPVSMKIQGSYHQTAQFFDRVSRLSRIVNIKDVSMAYGKEQGLLETSCRAVTYMFVEKVESDNTKESKRKKRERKK